jgi:serine/threonine protein kinase
MSQCLSEAEIQRCARRELSREEQSIAEEHLLHCAVCTARVTELRAPAPSPTKVATARAVTEADFAAGAVSSLPEALLPAASDDSDFAPPGAVTIEQPSSSAVSVEEFLSNLSQSGLLSPLDVAVVRKRSSSDPAASDLTSVITWLVKEHKLTHYQAQVLARGKGGVLILGNYIILEKLGQGGMGAVFKARHRRMNRLVALKVLPEALASIPEAIARFQREVQAAATLHHPNIATAYDADEAAGLHFLVMEYVEGPTLSAYVKATGPMPLAAAVGLVAQTARGLAAAHAAGIVHRDVKPSNLIVNRQGRLKILDLGLAQFHGEQRVVDDASDVTRTGSVMGTVDYMAPEQARDAKSVDHRADIYSLGCTLHFLVTGAPPAPPGSAAEKLLWHQTISPLPLGEVCPQASPRLAALVQRMVAKLPPDRPATMAEVADELEACAAEFPAGQAELTIGAIALAHDHTRSTMGGSGIQATQRELQTALQRAASPPAPPSSARPGSLPTHGELLAPPPRRSRSSWLVPACGLIGAAALIAILASPLIKRPPNPAPAGPQFPRHEAAPVTTNGRRPITTESPSPHAPYQELLTWVFGNGGSVTAVTGKCQQLTLSSESALPGEPLEIIAIR